MLLIVIDGAAPRVVTPAIQAGRLPNLKKLADAGEMQEAVTIFPSITPAATASLVTGVYPARHGIAGAAWYDAARKEVAYYGDDVWIIAKKGFGAFLRDFLVSLNGDRLTAPTLFETVERRGRRAACLNYLVYRGLVTHEVTVPLLLAMLPGVPLTETVQGPSTLCLGDFVRGNHRHQRHDAAGVLHRFGMDDAATGELLCRFAQENALPDLTVAYFADNDYRSHEVGPHAALPVIEKVDTALGAMFDAAGGFDRFMRDMCVVVTSDHGHCELLAEPASAAIQLDVLLGDLRQAALGGSWRTDDQVMICPNMRAAQIYFQRPAPALFDEVARLTLADERVDLVMWRRESAAPAVNSYVVMSQRRSLVFSRASGDQQAACDDYGTRWRLQGDLGVLGLERDGDRIASRDYPNPLERIAGVLDADTSGHIWVTARPGAEFQVPGGAAHVGGASHGSLHALDSVTPVIVAGGRQPLPRRLRSIDVPALCLDALFGDDLGT